MGTSASPDVAPGGTSRKRGRAVQRRLHRTRCCASQLLLRRAPRLSHATPNNCRWRTIGTARFFKALRGVGRLSDSAAEPVNRTAHDPCKALTVQAARTDPNLPASTGRHSVGWARARLVSGRGRALRQKCRAVATSGRERAASGAGGTDGRLRYCARRAGPWPPLTPPRRRDRVSTTRRRHGANGRAEGSRPVTCDRWRAPSPRRGRCAAPDRRCAGSSRAAPCGWPRG